MELSCYKAATLDSTRKTTTIIRSCCGDIPVLWLRIIGMDEVEVRLRPEAGPRTALRSHKLCAVPAHVRNLQSLRPESGDLAL